MNKYWIEIACKVEEKKQPSKTKEKQEMQEKWIKELANKIKYNNIYALKCW